MSWAPLPGSQRAFLTCPVPEVLYHGGRGGGKTDALLMDFAQDVGRGLGPDWRGVLFRRTYVELRDVVEKSRRWFGEIFPEASYSGNEHVWRWPTGERLWLAYLERPEDYQTYHGHSYQWIGFEELTQWPDRDLYVKMQSCLRTAREGVRPRVRATTNPYGPGHNWVRARWELPHAGLVGETIPGEKVTLEGGLVVPGMDRVAIRSHLGENRVMLSADPGYAARVAASASNEYERKAWMEGAWDIVSGGMFDDLWGGYVTVPDLDPRLLPAGWRLDRSYDHGRTRPFSVGWWAQSDGTPVTIGGRAVGGVRGDLIRFAEWYGWAGDEKRPNSGCGMTARSIARGIRAREQGWGIWGRVRPGVADASIFDSYEGSASVAGDMQDEKVRWLPSDKGPGSRKQGWEQVRARLEGSRDRDRPGLFACRRCEHFFRTMPSLPRSKGDPDDVDTDAEDHVADEVRYRVRARLRGGGSVGV